jgi:gluconolactonase
MAAGWHLKFSQGIEPMSFGCRWRSALTGCVAVALLLFASGPSFAAPAVEPERVATGLEFPEGAIFVGDALYFVDYGTSRVIRLHDGTMSTVWQDDHCGANGVLRVPEGLWVACFSGQTFRLITLEGQPIQVLDRDGSGASFESPNDLAADGHGGAWLTASGSSAAAGKVYHLSPSHVAHAVAGDLYFANGVATSPDGRLLYVTESTAGRISVFTVGPGDTLGERRDFVNLADVFPDGHQRPYKPDSMRTDRAGNLFVALYDGGGFAVFRPDKSLLAKVDVPLAHHTTLAISPDDRFVYVSAVADEPGGGYRGELYRVPNSAFSGP